MDFALNSCAWSGHETYGPTDHPELAARLRVDTAAGQAWRCLRCGDFVLGEPRRSGAAEDAPEVPSGRLLRDRLIMRLLAVERVLRGVVFLALAFGVYKVRDSQHRLHEAFDREMPLIRPLADQIGWNPDTSKIVHFIEKGWTSSPTMLTWVAVGLAGYAAIELIEAVGLWLVQRWGEYFAVIATGIFLPLEVYELTEKVTALRLFAFAVNVAAVVWLLWSKRLFGINGGGKAYHAEHHAESVLTVERSALAVPAAD